MFERLIYNNLFGYFIDNDFISQNQSGFKRRDSCKNQLISINHEYINLLTTDLQSKEFFLTYPTSKAFDKVWHDGLIYKLK